MFVNLPVKIIAALLIVSAIASTVYSVNIASEYTAAMQALAEFHAKAEYDLSSVENGDLYVNVTFYNPSGIVLKTYEFGYAFYMMNSSTMGFGRYATSGGGRELLITLDPHSSVTKRFHFEITDKENALWLLENDGHLVINQYMEIRFRVDDSEYTNIYAWGIPHYECATYGGGPFG